MTQTERDAKIYDLIKHELEWLINNPEHITNTAAFLMDGGFTQYTDAELTREHASLF
jgi:hypothetical protein